MLGQGPTRIAGLGRSGIVVGLSTIGDKLMDRLQGIVGDTTTAVRRGVMRLRRAPPQAPDRRRGHEAQRGQGLAEYALILAFIAIVAIAALIFFGEELFEVLSGQIGSQIGWVADNLP